MRAGLIASLAGHAAVVVWGLVALPDAETFNTTPVESLPVDLVPVEELTRLRKGEQTETEIRDVAALQPSDTVVDDAEQQADTPGEEARVEQPEPPAPEPAPQPDPVPTPDAAPPPPEPETIEPVEPAPAPDPAPEAEPAPQAPAPVRTNVTPRSKPAAPRTADRDFNPNQISALLNKVDPTGGGVASSQDPASLGSRRGSEDVQMSQSELDALRSQVSVCWSPPVGAVGAETLNVRVRFNLDPSGAVSASPEVLNSNSNPAFRAAASSAVRAIMRCAPYSLPVAKYEAWQEVIINFDPREMAGG